MSNLLTTALGFWVGGAWITHVIFCFTEEAWGFLIAGAIMFPVAWAHGTWLWFQ